MSERARMYRFSTAAQWNRGLADGFDVADDGSLLPTERFGLLARPFDTSGPASLVAADTLAGPSWRTTSNGRTLLVQRDPGDGGHSSEIDGALANTSRWVLARGWLWGFDGTSVSRYERDSLMADLTIPFDGTVHDIAADGRGSVWVLVESAGHECSAVHLDCDGCPDVIHRIPCEVRCGEPQCPQQFAGLLRGTRLVLLTPDGRLVFVSTSDGSVLQTVSKWRDDPLWRVQRLASDAANRIALVCDNRGDATLWAVFIFDGNGNTVDVVRGPQKPLPVIGPRITLTSRPDDVAMADGVLWLAADSGLWQLDASDASIARESSSTFLTPVLYSPPAATGNEWLRAEIDVDLPAGAVIEAEAVAASDNDTRQAVLGCFDDPSMSPAERQAAIWSLFDHSTSRVFHVTGAPAEGQPVAIPLFDVRARNVMGDAQAPIWLWLRLKLVTPPAVTPPAIRELRVLYPDSSSIVQNLPAIFRGSGNDPTGFLRSLVGVIEATTQRIDEKIRGIAGYLDAGTAPVPWLDYVARWLDLPWEDELGEDAKRRIVGIAGALLEWRATRRGLDLLVGALLGSTAQVRVSDMTVDYRPRRLGGAACAPGPRLPMLLAGAARAPVLGERAVLGRACLGVPDDPLRCLTPRLRIEITASRSIRTSLGTLLARIVAQYVPAGVRVVYVWKMTSPLLAAFDDGAEAVLDANGPGRLGRDSELGRTIVSGRGRLAGSGVDVGFRLS